MSLGYQISEVSSPAGLPRIFIQFQHTLPQYTLIGLIISDDDDNEEEILDMIAKY